MYLAIVLMTLTNRSFWYGRREPKTMVFGSWMLTGTTTLTFVKFPASRTWVWSTFMQPLALVVLGISELPQPVHLASTRITLVKIVPSQVELLTGYSRCNMAYPAKRTFRRKQKLLRRKWRCNRLWRKQKKAAPVALTLRPLPAPNLPALSRLRM